MTFFQRFFYSTSCTAFLQRQEKFSELLLIDGGHWGVLPSVQNGKIMVEFARFD